MAFQMQPRRSFGWQILTVAGVPFFVEVSFLIFIGLVLFMCLDSYRFSIPQAGMICFIIFFSLLAHEGGHALVARQLGLQGISVTLAMFMGVTRMPPTTHGRNLLITLAGPAGSLLMAGLGAVLYFGIPAVRETESTRFFTYWLMVLNAFWLIFNILPIFPMDGGQALFHGLTFILQEKTAFMVVTILSMIGCLIGGYLSLVARPRQYFILIFMCLFFSQNLQSLQAMRRMSR